MDKIRLIDAINSSKLDYNDIYDKVNVIKKKKSNFNIESYNEIVYLQMYIYHLKNGINTLSKNGNIPELIPKRISYEQFKIELEKYKNRAYAGRKKHDSAWMQSYNAFVVQYEKGKTIMEIVEQGDISRRTAYRYKAYYKKLKEKGMAVDKQD